MSPTTARWSRPGSSGRATANARCRSSSGRPPIANVPLFRIPDEIVRFASERYHPSRARANAAILTGVPPARQQRKDAAANRERVLDAATDLVRTDGEKVPMADIARHAGVGVGTVYRHFPTREHLLGALVHRSFGLAVDNAQ